VLSLRGRGAIAIVASAALLLVAGDGAARSKKAKKGAKGKKGKVVRVERSSVGAGVVRWCANPRPDGGATCYGLPPEVDEVGVVMDETGTRATVKVTEVKPTLDQCGNTASWEVASNVQSGDLAQLNSGVAGMTFDWKTTTRSKAMNIYGNVPVVAPGLHQGEMLLGAIDDDADDKPDLLIVWFYCDASGVSTQYGQGGHYCVVHYARDGASYQELRLDVVKNC
jgi:hypothetical protein